jgi:large subunit ribosomal protein L3
MALQAIVGEKVAMSQVWVNDKVVPVTVLRVEPARIVQVKTTERDGYTALQVTYGHKDPKKLTKPEAGHFAKAGIEPGRRVVELRLDSVDGFEVGQVIDVTRLVQGQKVDVTAVSRDPSARAASRAVCSRVCAWPATWATSRSPPSTSRWSRPTPSAICCW